MTVPTPVLPPATTMGAVRLTVADLAGVRAFYEQVVGLRTLEHGGDVVRLGIATDDTPLVELVGRADAPPRAKRSCGLFHLALLVPSRVELARALRRIAVARWPLSGASDHLVSEALYLADPEGNGIELYRDRPRDAWHRHDGELEMATLPLDLDGVIAELPAEEQPDGGMSPGTRMGHVHLQVSDLEEAERYYAGLLGFEVTVRSYPGALFVAAGGYHHHVGLNTWASGGGPPADRAARGLRSYAVELPDEGELARVAERLAAQGAETRDEDGALRVTDPFGIELRLSAAAPR